MYKRFIVLTICLGAAAALGLSLAQRSLSTPARALRRRVAHVDGNITMHDGSEHGLDAAVMLEPLERALSTLSCRSRMRYTSRLNSGSGTVEKFDQYRLRK